MTGHSAKTSKALMGAWYALCSCGWEGVRHYATGARRSAIADKWQHVEVIDERRLRIPGNAERLWGTTHALPEVAASPSERTMSTALRYVFRAVSATSHAVVPGTMTTACGREVYDDEVLLPQVIGDLCADCEAKL